MRVMAACLAVLAGLALVTFAFAHAAPERFNPSPGQVLTAAPLRLDGWFLEDVKRVPESYMQVLDASGARVDTGQTIVDDSDRRHMYVDLRPALPPGRYLVAYQTVSDEDGDAAGACYLFFVGQAAADQAHAAKLPINDPDQCPVKTEATATPAPGPSASSNSGGGVSTGTAAVIAVATAVLGVVAGAAGASALSRRRGG